MPDIHQSNQQSGWLCSGSAVGFGFSTIIPCHTMPPVPASRPVPSTNTNTRPYPTKANFDTNLTYGRWVATFACFMPPTCMPFINLMPCHAMPCHVQDNGRKEGREGGRKEGGTVRSLVSGLIHRSIDPSIHRSIDGQGEVP